MYPPRRKAPRFACSNAVGAHAVGNPVLNGGGNLAVPLPAGYRGATVTGKIRRFSEADLMGVVSSGRRSIPAAALALATTLSLPIPGSAQSETAPTFYADALPVFYENCVSCHQPAGPNVGGLVAPMSLMRYDEARRWATRI